MSKYRHTSPFCPWGSGKWRKFRLVVVSVLAACWIPAVHAQGIQPLNSIVAAVHQYLVQQNGGLHVAQLKVSVTPPDSRLRFASCASQLQVFSPPGQNTVGNTLVGVRCTDADSPWSLYVQASVSLIRPVVVTKYPMSRGTVLTGDDLTLASRDVALMSQGYLTDIKKVSGMVLRYSVTAGTVLRPNLLKAPTVVKRGEHVVLMAQGGGIQVKMEGMALADGAVGDVIRVRNLSSHRVVQGTVVSASVVQVPF